MHETPGYGLLLLAGLVGGAFVAAVAAALSWRAITTIGGRAWA